MGNYCGPKVKLSRSLGVPIAETPKHMRLRRENPPGMHPIRRGRRSLFARQLAEKQKLARYYNVRDGQLRRYMKEAARSKRNTPIVLHELLETRLDNIVRRLGWARTIWQARQMVVHGHFLVDDRRVNRPSFHVAPGSRITVRERSQKFVREASESAEFHLNLEWLQGDEKKLEATVVRMPTLEDSRIPFEIDYNMVVEYYSR
ncbi:MAG: 30S ribosomal protein S4 [Phycisphaerae bacterium]